LGQSTILLVDVKIAKYLLEYSPCVSLSSKTKGGVSVALGAGDDGGVGGLLAGNAVGEVFAPITLRVRLTVTKPCIISKSKVNRSHITKFA
jgi:hypothetical protein